MAKTATIVYRNLTNIGDGNYLVKITLLIQDDGIDIFTATVESIINKDASDKENVLKTNLENKLKLAWDQYLAANAISQSQAAFDSLCDAIITDVENYLNQ